MSDNKSLPMKLPGSQNRCPVCGEVSYSRGGVHPQCSVKQADASRIESLKRDKPKVSENKSERVITRWQKSCPECKTALHVRKKVCDCGYVFAVQSRPPAGGGESG